MKRQWVCTWETLPGDGRHREVFSSFAAAKRAMRQKIAENVDVAEYLDWLELYEEGEDCKELAVYLRKYLSDPEFPRTADDIPDILDLSEMCDAVVHPDYLRWKYGYNGVPGIETNLVIGKQPLREYNFAFWHERPDHPPIKAIKSFGFTITPETIHGTSAYPLLILKQLNDEPQTQQEIIDAIAKEYGCVIDRKAVGRHIDLLKELGYNIQHDQDGYTLSTSPNLLTGMEKNLLIDCVRAYPHMSETLRETLLMKVGCLPHKNPLNFE